MPLRPICGIFVRIIFVCLRPTLESPISECSVFAFVATEDRISVCLSMTATCPHDHPQMSGGGNDLGFEKNGNIKIEKNREEALV